MIKSKQASKFTIEELVPETVFNQRGEKAWQLIDTKLIENLDALRSQLGVPMTCNNWANGGSRQESGLRIVGQEYYSPYSQHSFGRAVDLVCSIGSNEIRRMIRNKEIMLPHAATFESGVPWLHMDVRNMLNDQTYFFDV